MSMSNTEKRVKDIRLTGCPSLVGRISPGWPSQREFDVKRRAEGDYLYFKILTKF